MTRVRTRLVERLLVNPACARPSSAITPPKSANPRPGTGGALRHPMRALVNGTSVGRCRGHALGKSGFHAFSPTRPLLQKIGNVLFGTELWNATSAPRTPNPSRASE